jgi:CheY-like chemotaxis protein
MPTACNGRQRSVLLADNNPMFRKLFARILGRLGYRVFVTADPLKAGDAVTGRGKIDLLLIDLPSLEFAAGQLAAWVRAMRPEVKVLVTSTNSWELKYQLESRLGQMRQIAFLPQPFTLPKLARTVRRLLS